MALWGAKTSDTLNGWDNREPPITWDLADQMPEPLWSGFRSGLELHARGAPGTLLRKRSGLRSRWCAQYPSAAGEVKHAAGVQPFGQPEVTAYTGQAEDGTEDILSVRLAS